jgi:hypothetical protein
MGIFVAECSDLVHHHTAIKALADARETRTQARAQAAPPPDLF